MLYLTVPAVEQWDEQKNEFIYTKERSLQLEHSLVSISKWESKWGKAFFSKKEKTQEEALDYIKCMTLTQNADPSIYEFLSTENKEDINHYIECPMTATMFFESRKGNANLEIITAELIYYWMIALNIPFECQKWHLNRLITLIKVCNVKNQPPKKRSRVDVMSRNTALNASRRKQFNTKG